MMLEDLLQRLVRHKILLCGGTREKTVKIYRRLRQPWGPQEDRTYATSKFTPKPLSQLFFTPFTGPIIIMLLINLMGYLRLK